MKLAGDYRFDAAVRDVWDALFDPEVLAAIMPGCEKLERQDGHFLGEIKVKVGPVSGNFAGKVDLKDIDEPKHYTMVIDGRGSAGFVKATAHVALAADGEGTKMTYDADAQVGGKLASVGQRLIDASTRAIVKEALEGLHTNVKIRAAAYRQAAEEAESESGAGAGSGSGSESPVPAEAEAAGTSAGEEPAATTDAPAATDAPATTGAPASADGPATATVEAAAKPEAAKPEAAKPATVEAAANPEPAKSEPAKSEPVKPEAAKPKIEYAKVTQGQMAASVAKEVGRSMWPLFLLGAAVIAALIYLLVR